MNKLIVMLVLLGTVVVGNSQLIYGTRGGAGGGSSAAAIPATIYYVATNGNNSTAVPGDATKPYGTVNAAFTAVVNNSTIYLMPGNHTVTPYNIYSADSDTLSGAATANLISKTNITVRGPGANIYGTGQGSLSFIKDCRDITFDSVGFLGSWPTTNAVANPTNYAHVFLLGGHDNIKFQDCIFDSFGMFGIGSLPNISLSANDNIQNLNISKCVFRNGGATNCSGFAYQGGAVFAKALKTTFSDNRCDNITSGVTYQQQYKRGSTTVEDTALLASANLYNDVKDSLVYTYPIDSASGYTNNCIVAITGEVGTRVEQNYPTTGTPSATAYNLSSATAVSITGNQLTAGYNSGSAVTATPLVSRVSAIITGNTFKGFGNGIYYDSAGVVNGFTVSGNVIERADAFGIYVKGKNINISNNRLLSVSTNTTLMSLFTGSQITVAGSVSLPSTNIVVSGNSFDDVVGDNPGYTTIFQSDTNCYEVNFIDNNLNNRYSAITNDLIMLRSSGVLKQKYTARTTTGTTYPIQFFHLPERTIAGIDYQIRAQSTSITGTNVGCFYIQRNAMKGAAGGSWGLGSGVTADLTLEDGPLSTASVTSGVSGSSASQFYVSVTGTNSTTIDWVLDMTARLLR